LLYSVGVSDYYGDDLAGIKMGLVYSCHESGEKYSNCKILVCQREGKRTLEKPRLKLICNVKLDLTKIGL
jgi:hypothetical protein